MILQGFRYFGCDLLTIERMRIREFRLRLKGATLRQLDRLRELSDLAILIRAAQAADSKGRYIVKTSKDLFDAEKQINRILGTREAVDAELFEIHERLLEYQKMKGASDGEDKGDQGSPEG